MAERRDPQQGRALRAWLENRVLPGFDGRILSVDVEVARASGRLQAARTRPVRDCLIAATALVHGLTLATRNGRDFADTGVRVVDPWAAT